MNDDAPLIEATLSGKSAAFGQLVQRYQDRLYNTMVHVVGHQEDARDVVQEAFVQAFLKLDSFRQESAFYTWLYRIAFHLAANRARRRHPTLSVEQVRETCNQEPLDRQAGPVERLEQEECQRQVRQAIASLDEEYRAVLVLREMDGCCYEEIAQMLELPIGTVRSRLHRARLQLREQLKEVLTLEP